MISNFRLKQLSQGVKASIAFFLASMITKGIAYITTPIYSRLLTTEEYGKVSVYLTWVQLFGIIAMFCLSYGVFNNGMLEYPDKRNEYSFSLLILSNIISLAFLIIIVSLYPLISSLLKIEFPFVLLMSVGFFFQPAFSFWSAKQRYELKYKALLIWTIVCAVISPSVAIFLIVFSNCNSNLYPRIFGADCSLILIYICFYIYLGYKSNWKIKTKYWKAALLFNTPLIPHYLSTYLLGSCDKIMISHIVSDSATAYYSVAHSIAAFAAIMWTAINGSLIPYTYENCKEHKYENINKVTLPLITLFAAGCVVVIMLAPEAVSIMAPKQYWEAICVIPPIVGGVFFQVQYYIYANIVYYYKKPVFVMFGSVTAVLLNIVLNYFFIKKFGYVAAGYTTIVCYLIQAIIDYYAMKHITKETVYNMKYIVSLSVIVMLIALFSNLIYDFAIIRYLILFVLLIVAFILRNKILRIFDFRKNK